MTSRITRVCVSGVALAGLVVAAAELVVAAPGDPASPALPTLRLVTTTTTRLSLPRLTFPFRTTTTTTTRVPRTTLAQPPRPTTYPPRTSLPVATLPVATLPPVTAVGTTLASVVPTTEHDHDEPACVYRGDLIVSTKDLSGKLADLGLTVPTPAQVPGLTEAKRKAMGSAHVFPYAVTPGVDPLAVVADLHGRGIVAGPVAMVMVAGHWTYVGDHPPTDLPDTLPGPSGGLHNPAQVAVLDTGYTAVPTDPGWLSRRVKAATPLDTDKHGDASSGHGKFVSSVIVQMAPNTEVTVGGLTPVGAGSLRGDGEHTVPGGLAGVSDELQLWLAMDRVLATNKPFVALNMSVGAYACPGAPAGLAIQSALLRWFAKTGGKPVIAAAGNHVSGEDGPFPPFVPASLSDPQGGAAVFDPSLCDPAGCPVGQVLDVQSAGPSGKQSDFSNPGHCAANGEDVLGVHLPGGQASVWSGTSFATAIITGAVASGTPVACDGSVVPSPAAMHKPGVQP